MKRDGILALTALALALGCEPRSKTSATSDAGASTSAQTPSVLDAGPPADRFSEEGMLAEAKRYVEDGEFRRETLTQSLTNAKNTYSRQRLESYGLKTRGWDLLPEWNPKSVPATLATAEDLRAGRPLTVDPATPPLWNGKTPVTKSEWIALGREVFLGYPLRSEIFMRWALTHPAAGTKVGVLSLASGEYPGVRVFVDVDGTSTLGITCALCHSNVKAGGLVLGEARRTFDYGALRLAYHADMKVPVDADLARRMKTWGPGRADVTEDDDEDPVAIPDLWGLRHQSFLTQAGTIKHVGPTALAIRQETQLLHSNHQKIRPPRVLAYALAMFLYSLEPPPQSDRGDASRTSTTSTTSRGHSLFAKHCHGCHSNPALGGSPVPAEVVGTEHSLADGKARGTGKYRPPALVRVAGAAPYLHQGAVPTLEDMLAPERLTPSYARSPLGKGAVIGHVYGTELSREDRAALVAYLRTL